MMKCLLTDVGDIACELFASQLGFADLDIEFIKVNGSINVFLHQTFRKDNRVFEVVAGPRHERDKHVSPQGQRSSFGGSTVTQQLTSLHLVADGDNWFLVQTRPLV